VKPHLSDKQKKKLADDARLLRWWKAWHREEREAVLTGPHARTLAELFRMFSAIKHVTPAQLIGFIGAIDWSAIDYETRLTVLHAVNEAITKFRESKKLDPISDPLPGAPPNAFQIIRKILTELPASSRARPTRRGPDPGANDEQ
jgi:hypothetical protein